MIEGIPVDTGRKQERVGRAFRPIQIKEEEEGSRIGLGRTSNYRAVLK